MVKKLFHISSIKKQVNAIEESFVFCPDYFETGVFKMSKQYMLKEVDASSEAGDKIIVEQIYEKLPAMEANRNEFSWSPMFKVVITDKVIQLNDDLTFTHPRTGKVFRLSP